MTNTTSKQCKSKGCYRPVLEGKHCRQCTKKRKEKRDQILAGAGCAILVGGAAIKQGVIKQGPKIARVAIKVILKV